MHTDEARRLLGVAADAEPDQVRVAYRRLVREQHPDRNTSADATERTIELTTAYRLLVDAPVDAGASDAAETRTVEPEPPLLDLSIDLVDDTTIALGAPGDETLFLLSETAHRLGEITYLDPAAGLIEVIVEFVEAPTSSVVFTLQGRATGVTDVFCTVEPLSGGEAPPVDAVTRLVFDTVAAVAVDHHRRPVHRTAPT